MGLVDKLRSASSENELISVLEEGKQFEDVSPKTKRKWVSVYTRTLKILQKKKDGKLENSETPVSENAPVNKYKKKKKIKKV